MAQPSAIGLSVTIRCDDSDLVAEFLRHAGLDDGHQLLDGPASSGGAAAGRTSGSPHKGMRVHATRWQH
ncbi:hypothetical protein ACIA8E_04730 [Streptomyces sp. NPDC051664]|uniref:hypothetical protein n=1 Tax=Streptomyces sp. NPDC051664 TaxID=3365668 RepID=UPI00379E7421